MTALGTHQPPGLTVLPGPNFTSSLPLITSTHVDFEGLQRVVPGLAGGSNYE